MNEFVWTQFFTLLRRELWEQRGLFVMAPVGLAAVISVVLVWALAQFSPEQLTEALTQVANVTRGLSVGALAPLLMPGAIPFALALLAAVFSYLLSGLYQDRRDGSILFWQSMPVSDLATVMSKVVTACVVAPLAMTVVVLISMLTVCLGLVLAALLLGGSGLQPLTLLAGVLYSGILIYLSAVLALIWQLPILGWLLVFSAYARALPLVWATATFVIVMFLEDFLFGSQFLATWLQTRAGLGQYLVFSPLDFLQGLLSYDMVFNLVLSAILITGAIFLRRHPD